MKFLKFFLVPHRIIALLLGFGFLAFTQTIVFKPMEAVINSVPKEAEVLTVSQIVDKQEQSIPEIDENDFDFESLYLGDLMVALEEMSEEEEAFQGLIDLDVKIKKQENTDKKIVKNPKVAIVIDDLGMNRTQSWNSVKLEFPVTLAFLPYAENIQELADEGAKRGHDIILHVPMAPLNSEINAGENVLSPDLSEVLLTQTLEKNLIGLSDYVGINNHMGSAFTQDRKGMNVLMSQLKKKGLMFLDSRTTADSVAEELAGQHGVPFIQRDVFLDHEETEEYTKKALKDLERIAFEHGQAVAIGHPKAITLNALKKWVVSAQKKGIQFVTLSELVAQ